MIEHVFTINLPNSAYIYGPDFFGQAHIENTQLGSMILTEHRSDKLPPTLRVMRLHVALDVQDILQGMRKLNLGCASLPQILPLFFIEDFCCFEAVYALGSVSARGSVPYVFVPKKLSCVIDSEKNIAANSCLLREILESVRGGRWVGSNFLTKYTSKGILIACI